ncbi:PIN domain-containing protein [Streptomyces sp. A3M-1-3]|uniref:PIN domain-containing protein n=1 Tax=Streptomyces sp. A3M-1-3 TaxID=2962044 RepID=UPI0020B75DEF|nr:PIN domain-containing protein [Streptomyces sp. A3M-1-3]MCP3818397.1 PIN domain-containing protein [Streptomyces sp. A3M-1-3]
MTEIPVAIADTNALYRLFTPKDPRHSAHREALAHTGHLIVSPMILTELDYLLTIRIGVGASMNALDFIARQVEARRFEVPEAAPHLRSAMAVMRGCEDADGGRGVGLADAMNVVLAAAFQTADMFTTDRHFRMMRPLTAHGAFRLLPDDL